MRITSATFCNEPSSALAFYARDFLIWSARVSRNQCQIVKPDRIRCSQIVGDLLVGEMAEWFKAHAWKACVGLYPTLGSNPSLSANFNHPGREILRRGLFPARRLGILAW
jgi:hypothetical protein